MDEIRLKMVITAREIAVSRTDRRWLLNIPLRQGQLPEK